MVTNKGGLFNTGSAFEINILGLNVLPNPNELAVSACKAKVTLQGPNDRSPAGEDNTFQVEAHSTDCSFFDLFSSKSANTLFTCKTPSNKYAVGDQSSRLEAVAQVAVAGASFVSDDEALLQHEALGSVRFQSPVLDIQVAGELELSK